ncbi:flagellar biosynthesis anti-sigma factor FlgM [Pantoea sp. 1.19]|uniref:flagellar biosynthesis anti-sigma factor FlgM n=1 Tax=Pantoea sp. 1.19 TaxID=1925589 RepID=UPI000948C5B7|nr:flagellar biosynthesis anti-sigma factor FlgM [Pantoea sp. 1.19]
MSIDRTPPLKPVSTVQPRENSEASSSKTRPHAAAAPASAAQVTLSGAQAQLMQPGAQDINSARVEALKTAIRHGELKMDAGKIADALLQDTQDYLKGQ